MSTRTCFEKEVKGNSELVYWDSTPPLKLICRYVYTSVYKHSFNVPFGTPSA